MNLKPLKKIAFVDRDGTIIYEPPKTKQIDCLKLLRILPGVIGGLRWLLEQNFELVMISNQDKLGTNFFPTKDFKLVQKTLLNKLRKNGIKFSRVFICPHSSADNCTCRKPKTGLVTNFLRTNTIDRNLSCMIGDRKSDEGFARNLGLIFYRTQTNGIFTRKFMIKRQVEIISHH